MTPLAASTTRSAGEVERRGAEDVEQADAAAEQPRHEVYVDPAQDKAGITAARAYAALEPDAALEPYTSGGYPT